MERLREPEHIRDILPRVLERMKAQHDEAKRRREEREQLRGQPSAERPGR